MLSLRSILWWWNIDREIILPNASNEIQSKLSIIKDWLLSVLSLSNKNVKIGDFNKLSDNKQREPYMKTPYYFDNDFIKENMEMFKLIRNFWDKVFLAHFIKNNWFAYLIPDNTYTYLLWENFSKVKNEAINRFNNRKSFIIKWWEWASWENMILVFFEQDKIYVAHSHTNWKKEINNKEDFLKELEIAIPKDLRYKEWEFNINGYDTKAISEQNYLIQDLVDTKKYEEKSINFYITEDDIFPTTFWKNLAIGWVHRGNIEEVLSKKILNKFIPLLEKIKSEWYTGAIGFDFFYNNEANDVKIIEANTRYTAPITPSMLVYKLQEQWKIPKNWTWRLIQKFETKQDLTKIDWIKKDDLVKSILKEEDIKEAKFLVYSPIFWEKYQSVIIIWPNQEKINDLYNKVDLIINGNR